MKTRRVSGNNFIFFSNSSITKVVDVTLEKLKTLRQDKKPIERLRNNEILQIIIEHNKFLCEIFKTPSFDILSCEHLLVMFMKAMFCDHHRQYFDFLRQCNYFSGTLEFIWERVHDAFKARFFDNNE